MTLIKVDLIFGGGGLSTGEASLGSLEEMKEAISLLEKGDVRIIDTASTYGDSEEVLGELGAAKTHTLHSKYPGGFSPEPSKRDGIITAATEGLEKTGAKQVRIP
jgi:aryl-alcohol dehydrogenase-like predicted oxidoreductase